MPVAVTIVGDELDVRSALGHATDEGEVIAYGPQSSRWRHVIIAAINYEDCSPRSLLAHRPDHKIRVLIEGVGERLELLDCDRGRSTSPSFSPAEIKRPYDGADCTAATSRAAMSVRNSNVVDPSTGSSPGLVPELAALAWRIRSAAVPG